MKWTKRLHGVITRSLPVLLLLAGCGGTPPVREPISPLYTALTDEFTAFNFNVLRGKKILIDPGHGGRFTGTTGQDGLEEKSVNLGVSLYLWGLLKEAGADAYLTRAADRDFLLAEAESDLTRDLAARVAISDSLDPDLFLSVHHNARGDTNRAFNQIEVYYPMADDGPSRDAAHAIFFHLKRNLGEAKGRVIPGNFYVLRENGAPAVLGESSYLSHPPVEEKLKLSDIQRLEAEAYFLGVTRYFMSGAPRAWFVADDLMTVPGDTIRSVDEFHVQAVVRDEDGFAGIDPSTIELTLDGAPLAHRFLPGSDRVQAALPYTIANAPHELTLRARNRNGNSTKVERREVLVDLPVDESRIYGLRDDHEGRRDVVLAFPDARGRPIRDQKFLFDFHGTREVWIRSGTAAIDQLPADEFAAIALRYAHTSPELRGTLHVHLSAFPEFDRVMICVPDQPLWRNDSLYAYADAFGLAGWNGTGMHRAVPVKQFPGAPNIVIDPDNGPAGVSRACARNPVEFAAGEIVKLLDWLGPGAILSHHDARPPAPAVRIRQANSIDAELWISIEAGSTYQVTHFPGSRRGGPAAESIAEEIRSRLGVSVPVLTGTEPVLRDTPCPAVIVEFPAGEDCGREETALLRTLALAVAQGAMPFSSEDREKLWETAAFDRVTLPDLQAGDQVFLRSPGIVLEPVASAPLTFRSFAMNLPGEIWLNRNGNWSLLMETLLDLETTGGGMRLEETP